MARRAVLFLVRILGLVGAPMGRIGLFYRLLAVVGTWGDQPPSGVVGGGPRVTRRCTRRCGADLCPWPGRGGRFFFRGVPSEISGWVDRARRAPRLRLEIQAPHVCPFEGVGGDCFPLMQLRCGTPDTRVDTGDLYGICQSAPIRAQKAKGRFYRV
jgi:hypothetical protein